MRGVDGMEHRFERGHDGGAHRGFQLVSFGWRHDAVADLGEHAFPSVAMRPHRLDGGKRRRIECEAALAGRIVVAIETVLHNEGPDVLRKDGLGRGGLGRSRDGRSDGHATDEQEQAGEGEATVGHVDWWDGLERKTVSLADTVWELELWFTTSSGGEDRRTGVRNGCAANGD